VRSTARARYLWEERRRERKMLKVDGCRAKKGLRLET
jgi:hypothetical protein